MPSERIGAAEAADFVFRSHVDADQIWADFCRLPDRGCSPVIACCELAFVRIAIVKFMMIRTPPRTLGESLCRRIDEILDEVFPGEGDSETGAFYGMPLSQAARSLVQLYFQNAASPVQLGSVFSRRIGGGTEQADCAAYLFRAFGGSVGETLKALRIAKPRRPWLHRFSIASPEGLRQPVA